METITLTDTRQLPKGKLNCYLLDRGETIESASQKYEDKYGRKPERVYLWDKYAYFETVL